MKNSAELKKIVKDKYQSVAQNETPCCGPECGCANEVNFIGDDYREIEGYHPDADLGLGCGLPTEYAQINEGQTVVDLGSGAGNDCFIARNLVGPEGKVVGVDFTEAMIEKARENALKLNYSNVHFIKGDIENIPLPDEIADVVVSNCVLNLVPDKAKAYQEAYRILKPGGHFSISDVVIKGSLPSEIQSAAEMYSGCVSGAMQKSDYLKVIAEAGFQNIEIQKEREVAIPTDILKQWIPKAKVEDLISSGAGVFSITVYGKKAKESCCSPECCNN